MTGGSTSVADAVDLGDIVVGEETFTATGPATFEINISNAGEALVGFGVVTAPVRATCSRCLVEFEMSIAGDIEGYWLRPGDSAPEDQDVTGTVDSEGAIDIVPALLAALIVEAPFAPLHDENCAGLCPECGGDLNEHSCNCGSGPASDHPFAALGSLIETGDGEPAG